jgi:hypothetical protein
MFTAREGGNLELLTQGPTPKHLAPVYGETQYLPVSSSISGDACLGLNYYAGPYHRAAKTTHGIPIGATSSSSTSATSLDQDSIDDYPKIRGSTCWNSTDERHLSIMMAPAGVPSQNSSSRYPTIDRSEASDAQMPNDEMIWDLNPNFNAMWLQTIMESIQRMSPKGSPLIALAQQGAEAANYVIAE